MDLQVEYLNKILYNKLKYSGPKFLYKYRPFDQYTFDMLDKGYLYLCPAEKLDDKSECNTSIDVNSLIDLETNNLKRVCVYQIMEMICSYSTEDNFEVIKSKLEIIMNHTGTLKPNFLLDLSFELEKIAPGIDIAPIVNWIINIPEKLDDLAIKPQMESFLSLSMNAKQEIGICSLCAFCSICASDDVERIWANYYADYDSGYCIEYQVDDYELNSNILPVVYSDDRNTNIVIQLIGNFIGQLIQSFSNGQMFSDRSQFTRLLLTKNTGWSYQKEWRFVGKANDKPKSPKVRRIIVGKNISQENYEKICSWCEKNNVQLERRGDIQYECRNSK